MKKQIIVLPKETSDAQCFYYKFWQNFNLYSETHEDFKNEFEIKKIHSVRCYQDYSLQRSFHSVVKLNKKSNQLWVGIYFNNTNVFLKYRDDYRTRIEKQIPYEIEWTMWNTKGSAYITTNLGDITDKNNWEKIYNWFIENSLLMKKGFCSLE